MEVKKRKDRFAKSEISLMSSTTKKFLQKICHKESESVDMTQYGFMRDSKVFKLKLMIRPLFLQLQKIFDKTEPNVSPKQLCKRVRLADSKMSSQIKKRQRHEKKKLDDLKKSKSTISRN